MVTVKFEVGDKVYISEDSQYFSFNDSANPRNVVGEITDIHDYDEEDLDSEVHFIQVLWNNKRQNIYRLKDLKLYTGKLPKDLEEEEEKLIKIQEMAAVKQGFQKGDAVQIIGNKGKHYFKKGTKGTIKYVDLEKKAILVESNDSVWGVNILDIVKIDHSQLKPKACQTSKKVTSLKSPRTKKATTVTK